MDLINNLVKATNAVVDECNETFPARAVRDFIDEKSCRDRYFQINLQVLKENSKIPFGSPRRYLYKIPFYDDSKVPDVLFYNGMVVKYNDAVDKWNLTIS